jgi:hypothetical protein
MQEARYKVINAREELLGRVATTRLIADLVMAVRHQVAEEIRHEADKTPGTMTAAVLNDRACMIDPFVLRGEEWVIKP